MNFDYALGFRRKQISVIKLRCRVITPSGAAAITQQHIRPQLVSREARTLINRRETKEITTRMADRVRALSRSRSNPK